MRAHEGYYGIRILQTAGAAAMAVFLWIHCLAQGRAVGNHHNLIGFPAVAVDLVGEAVFDGNFGVVDILDEKTHIFIVIVFAVGDKKDFMDAGREDEQILADLFGKIFNDVRIHHTGRTVYADGIGKYIQNRKNGIAFSPFFFCFFEQSINRLFLSFLSECFFGKVPEDAAHGLDDGGKEPRGVFDSSEKQLFFADIPGFYVIPVYQRSNIAVAVLFHQQVADHGHIMERHMRKVI